MSNTTLKSAPKVTPPPSADADSDDDDLFDGGDYVPLPNNLEEENIKRDSRRKIEIYWEKKRLKEQLDGEDFDDTEFDF